MYIKNIFRFFSKKNFIGNIGFCLICIFCLLYSYTVFFSKFAEKNIQLSFLNFPIFAGEILLICCLFLFCLRLSKKFINVRQWPKSYWLLIGYFLFVIIKALIGYLNWGPLALRNAALFYYSIFAVLTYSFFSRSFLKNKAVYSVVIIMLFLTILIRWPNHYYRYTYLALFLAVVFASRSKVLIYGGILFILVSLPRQLLLASPRGEIIADIFSALFLFVCLFSFLRIRKRYILICSLALIVFIGVSLYMLTSKTNENLLINKYDFKSLVLPMLTVKSYVKRIEVIDAKIEDFKQTNPMQVKLYVEDILPPKKFVVKKAVITVPETKVEQAKIALSSIPKEIALSSIPKEIALSSIPKEIAREPEQIGLDNNIVWRLLVWKDMIAEVLQSGKNVFGLDFGKPFRSKSIEILNWSYGLWVGWLEPHNSYIHILYRAGIMGIVLISVMLSLFITMVFRFLKRHDAAGIFLCSILIYWMVLSNFEVILELPYFAIPFWSLFGATFAYCNKGRIIKK
jgi:hypothetical protein